MFKTIKYKDIYDDYYILSDDIYIYHLSRDSVVKSRDSVVTTKLISNNENVFFTVSVQLCCTAYTEELSLIFPPI